MPSLAAAQKSVSLSPFASLRVTSAAFPQGVEFSGRVGRYKFWEKVEGPGHCAVWLHNAGGYFNNLSYHPFNMLTRGAPVEIRRGIRVSPWQQLQTELPRCWIEDILYVEDYGQPYLYLSCIDWATRLRYFRYSGDQSWAATEVQSIVSSILGQVGLTLDAGSFTSMVIDFTLSKEVDGWTAVKALMAKVPQVLFAKTRGTIGFKTLDSTEASGYSYGPGQHPTVSAFSESGWSSARYNSIHVTNGSNSYTAESAAEIARFGYRRRYISDTTLDTAAKCQIRAQAELEMWLCRTRGNAFIQSRPNFYTSLMDVVTVTPLVGGGAVTGHVTKRTEWLNFDNRPYDQGLVLGELGGMARLDQEPFSFLEELESIQDPFGSADPVVAAESSPPPLTADYYWDFLDTGTINGGLVAVGDDIYQIEDKESGKLAEQATTSQMPEFKSTGGEFLYVSGSSTQQRLELSPRLTLTAPYSIYFCFTMLDPAPSSYSRFFARGNDEYLIFQETYSNAYFSSDNFILSTPLSRGVKYVGLWKADTVTSGILRVNGVQLACTSVFDNTQFPLDYLGGYENFSCSNSIIHEIMIFNSYHSTSETESIEAYLLGL